MKTKKVRIALQIDPEGNWDAGGDSCVIDDAWDSHNGNFDLEHAKRYWIEAEVPVPEKTEVEVVAGVAVEDDEEAEAA